MPQCFNFTRTSDGEIEYLSKVDDAIREATGEPPNDVDFCMTYEAIVWTGLAIGIESNTSPLTEEAIRKFSERVSAERNYDAEQAAAYLERNLEWLFRRYRFSSWYGH